MGFLFDLLFGATEPGNGARKSTAERKSPFDEDYEYYESVYDDAMMGDPEAQAEMEDLFGDDWEDEF